VDRINRTINILDKARTRVCKEVDHVLIHEGDIKDYKQTYDRTFEKRSLPLYLNQSDHRYFIKIKMKLPIFDSAYSYRIQVSTGREGQWDAVNPQMLAYINGQVKCGLDTNHQDIVLDSAYSGEEVEIGLHLYTGMDKGDLVLRMNLLQVSIAHHDAYYDLKVAYDVLKLQDKQSVAYDYLDSHLHKAIQKLNMTQINDFLMYMKTHIYGKTHQSPGPKVYALGHTHIDVAWLWDLRQTKEKVARSYATALSLQDRFPNYKFMASQPVLYEMLEARHPDIFKEIQDRHESGQWSSEGAMYLEADCNLISGESMIRQIERGRAYFKEKFNHESKVLWLPDVFGYSAAMPQILKGFGIDLFVTSKISWNDTNKLPYDSFIWQGIDGSQIPTQFITTIDMERLNQGSHRTIYEGNFTPSEVLGSVKRHQQRQVQPNILMPYGFGDGGGGANESMLEYGKRLTRGIKGMPEIIQGHLDEFVEAFSKVPVEDLPLWMGELYLEYHRGTYTTNGLMKKLHRTLEDLLLRAEKIESYLALAGQDFTFDLEDHWRVLLLNQFHDILPGTSIKKVYDDAFSQLEYAIEDIENQIARSPSLKDDAFYEDFIEARLVETKNEYKGKFSQNVNTHYQLIGDQATDYPCNPDPDAFETPYYRGAFDQEGNLSFLYDKKADRYLIKEGGFANKIILYRDQPKEWDAWDISDDYESFPLEGLTLESITCISQGVLGLVFQVVKSYKASRISQLIVFYNDHPAIDFKTHIDWHEDHVLMRTYFDFNVHASHCKYSIQNGYVERSNTKNTSYDQAMFEVCGQHFANLSEAHYNVSLMSNYKYGYSCLGNRMGLTLLKSPTWPNPMSDKGKHDFSYRLLAQNGSFSQSYVYEAFKAYTRPVQGLDNKLMSQLRQAGLPLNISCESFRCLEKGLYEVRLVEMMGSQGSFELNLPYEFKTINLTDLRGRIIQRLDPNGKLKIKHRGFEIISIRFST